MMSCPLLTAVVLGPHVKKPGIKQRFSVLEECLLLIFDPGASVPSHPVLSGGAASPSSGGKCFPGAGELCGQWGWASDTLAQVLGFSWSLGDSQRG